MIQRRAKRFYVFGIFRIDVTDRALIGEKGRIPLTPKAFDTLLLLVENSGHVLSKDDLMARVWPDSFVEENNLAQNISVLRKALAEDTQGGMYIETVPKRGYRFTADVSESVDAAPDLIVRERTRARVVIEEETGDDEFNLAFSGARRSPHLSNLPREALELAPGKVAFQFDQAPKTMYAKSGDVNIAYQVLGEGPIDLVFVMGWVSHLEYFWREPSFARFLLRLASFSRLILFDKRGTGLSDSVPVAELPTLEQRMDDVRAVMDAVGSERAALCGVSEGGPMCSLFAATYPEKTLALVMIGTYAKRIRDAEYPWAPTTEEREHFFEEIRAHWGGPVGIEERAPSVSDDAEFRQWWSMYLRSGASPGAALALTQMNAEIDVRHVLPSIRVPTLVIHRKDDQCLKVEEGRYVAERIPEAKYVELEGIDHLPFVGDQDEILDEVEEFLTGARHTLDLDRVLATVLFTRITGPSAPAALAGDEDWERLLDRLRRHANKEIQWFRGREIDLLGNRPLAIFDGPARAIRCACAIRDHAARLGIELRAGLHTGECDVVDGAVGGIATEIGAQVANSAASGEVLVSSTVKDLVAGSGIIFAERGTHSLSTIPGEWHMFAVECASGSQPKE